MKSENIDVVIVTYGNRKMLLSKVLETIDKISFSSINIVVNGPSDFTEHEAKKIIKNNEYAILSLDQNEGSVGGFMKGILYSKNRQGNWILLLDDDTLFNPEDLYSLLENYNASFDNSKNIAFSFYRRTWSSNLIKLDEKYLENSFFGKNFLKKKEEYKKDLLYNQGFFEKVYCPYSGFLFPKDCLNKISLPPLEMFLYVDDTFFTYSIYKAGYTILEDRNIELKDLEMSWAKGEKHIPTLKQYFQVDNPYRGLMNLRNRVFFEKNFLVKSKAIYFVNMLIYMSIVFFIFMPKNRNGFKKFGMLINSINSGWEGELGKAIKKMPELSL